MRPDPLDTSPRGDVERRLADVERRLALLEARTGPRDPDDGVLLATIALSTRALPFRASDLLGHARLDAALRAALANATITTSKELGCWLRTMQGERQGVRLERLPRRKWRAVHMDM